MFLFVIIFSFLSIGTLKINATECGESVFRVVYRSSDLESDERFYRDAGIDFVKQDIGGILHLSSSKSLITLTQRMPSDKSLFGIIHYGALKEQEVSLDYNGLLCCKFSLDLDVIFSGSQDPFAHVIRVEDIEKAKEFFEDNGIKGWVKEQHGKGPIHYALENAFGSVIELYPWKKDQSSLSLEHISLGNEKPGSLSNAEKTVFIRRLT